MTRLNLIALLTTITTVHGAALPSTEFTKRDIEGVAQNAGDGVAGELYLKHKPWLEVHDGCVPFPAVNAKGEVSGGLKTSGPMNGECKHSKGQVYCRSGSVNGKFAIMYAWYFPKDQVALGPAGHKHDWEDVVVFLEEEKKDAKLKAVTYSAHGDYVARSGKDLGDLMDGDRPKVAYGTNPGTHSVMPTDKKGNEQPLIKWSALPQAARDGLAKKDWGDDVVCPLCDEGTFDKKINEAAKEAGLV